MTHHRHIFCLFASTAMACATLPAQDSGRPGHAPIAPMGRPAQTDSQAANDNTENYLKSLKEARVEQIKTRLDVGEERAAAIATKWAELEAPIRRAHPETMSLWRQMQYIIQEASPEKEKSRKIKPILDQYIELRKEIPAAMQRLYRELPTMFDTPIQQARMMLLMEEMERKERSNLKARMAKRRQQGE